MLQPIWLPLLCTAPPQGGTWLLLVFVLLVRTNSFFHYLYIIVINRLFFPVLLSFFSSKVLSKTAIFIIISKTLLSLPQAKSKHCTTSFIINRIALGISITTFSLIIIKVGSLAPSVLFVTFYNTIISLPQGNRSLIQRVWQLVGISPPRHHLDCPLHHSMRCIYLASSNQIEASYSEYGNCWDRYGN